MQGGRFQRTTEFSLFRTVDLTPSVIDLTQEE